MLGFQELGQYMQNMPSLKQKESPKEEDKGEPMLVDEPAGTGENKNDALKKPETSGHPVNPSGGGKKKKKGKR